MNTIKMSIEFLKKHPSVVLPNLFVQIGAGIIGFILGFAFIMMAENFFNGERYAAAASVIIIFLIIFLGLLLIQFFAYGATMGLIKRKMTEEVSWTEFMSEGKKYFLKILGVSTWIGLFMVLAGLLFFGGFFIINETGNGPMAVITLIIGYLALIYFSFMSSLSLVVIVEEKEKGINAIVKHTFGLPAQFIWSTFGTLFLLILGMLVLTLITAFIPPLSMLVSLGLQAFSLPFMLVFMYYRYKELKKEELPPLGSSANTEE